MARLFARFVSCAVVVFGVLALSACDDDSPTASDPATALLRLGHVSHDVGPVSMTFDADGAEAFVVEEIQFGNFTTYRELSPPVAGSTYDLVVRDEGGAVVLDVAVDLAAGDTRTLAIAGPADALTTLVVDDDVSPEADVARVRVVHAGPDLPRYDVISPDGTLFVLDTGFGDGPSAPVDVDPSSNELQLRDPTNGRVVLGYRGFTPYFPANTVSTVWIADGSPVFSDPDERALIISQDRVDATTPESRTIFPWPATIGVLNLSPDLGAIDAYLDDDLYVAAREFVDPQVFHGVPQRRARTYRFRVFKAGADPATVAPEAETFVTPRPGEDLRVGVVGFASDPGLTLLRGSNDDPDSGVALLRVLNAVPDAPVIDVLIDDGSGEPEIFTAVGFGLPATAFRTLAEGRYDVSVRRHDDPDDLLFTISGLRLENLPNTLLVAGSSAPGAERPVTVIRR